MTAIISLLGLIAFLLILHSVFNLSIQFLQAADIDNSELFQPGICCYATVNSLNQYMGEDQLLIYYMRVNTVDKNANVHKQYIKPKEEEPSPSHVKHKKKAKKLEQD